MNTSQTKLPKAIEKHLVILKETLHWFLKNPEHINEPTYNSDEYGASYQIINELKNQIAQALQTQTEEYRKRIEEMRKHFSIIITTSGKEAMTVQEWQMKGYNQALNDVLNILKETK